MQQATIKMIVLLVALLSVTMTSANAETAATDPAVGNAPFGEPVEFDDVQQGRLVFSSPDADDGGISRYYLAPTLKTDVTMVVTGLVARVTVKQYFNNPNTVWLDGAYTFPLPERSAVDHLTMQIGERLIEGQIKPKGQAQAIFHQAQRDGKTASLVAQHRPNLFTTSLANIGPGEDIMVEIEYQQILHYEQGEFSLRFPMVVAPRYIAGEPINTEYQGSGWLRATDQVPDADALYSPIKDQPSAMAAIDNDTDQSETDPEAQNLVSIQIDLTAGFELASLTSDHHDLDIQTIQPTQFAITLKNNTVKADQDFILRFKPSHPDQLQAAFFTQQTGQANYGLLMVLPPYEQANQGQILAKEMVFVIDTSGSMHGESMNQAKQALQAGLQRLRAGDRFNIVEFNSHTRQLFSQAMPINPDNLARAQRFVRQLAAEGGTEIAIALNQVLGQRHDPEFIRQVIFITDGSVANEEPLLDLIQQRLANSRLFTIGIGSAPNTHFMSAAASIGRGTFTYINDVSQVAERISALFAKLESPVLSDVKISGLTGQQQADYWPNPVADLYLSEPLIVSIKLPLAQQNLTVTGRLADRPWQVDLPIAAKGHEQGLDVLWARNKIHSLSEQARTPIQRKAAEAAITDLALGFHLVSRYTSLVAVDVTPRKPESEQAINKKVALHLPDGWTGHQPYGQLPRGATSGKLNLLLGMMLLLLAIAIRFYQQARSRQARLFARPAINPSSDHL